MEEILRRELIKEFEDGEMKTEQQLLSALLLNAFGEDKDFCDEQKLLRVFPSIEAMTTATYDELITAGATDAVALYLMALGRLKNGVGNQLFINNSEDCIKLAKERLCSKDVEYAEIYLVAKNGRLVEVLSYTSKLAGRVELPSAKMLSGITIKKTYGLYFVHNHVNCDVSPSVNDDRVTVDMQKVCDACGIKFHDHCIINTAGESFSYRTNGLMKK